MDLQSILVDPFAEFGFMRRALAACLILSASTGPIGTLLVLRRMSMVGDAVGHALLPGAALGFVCAGFSIAAMSAGGFIAALSVALLAGAVTRLTPQTEDSSFAAFYLIALALGVVLVSIRGSSVDLMHILFGNILAVDDASLLSIAVAASLSLVALAAVYRPLVLECFDPGFARTVARRGGWHRLVFPVLLVLNLVAGFVALGSLMAVGLMILPAAAARFWKNDLGGLALLASGIAAFSSAAGLVISYHADLPSGPAVVLCAGVSYLLSVCLGVRGGLLSRFFATAIRAER